MGGKPRPSERPRGHVDASALVNAADHYEAAYQRQLSSYARTRLPAPIGAMNAAVHAGAALAVAGASPKRYRSHWKVAAKMLTARLKFQARRTGYVSLGVHDWDIVAAAYLARAEARIVEVYENNPKLFAEQLGVPRARFFERALIAVLAGGQLEVTEAEDEVLSHDSVHAHWVALLTAVGARDHDAFRTALVAYLRDVHAPLDDARREADDDRRPYPGPLSLIACALCAAIGGVPKKLPADVEPFVLGSLVKAARRNRP